MERQTKDGTHYTTGTKFPTYQDMANTTKRHAEVVKNYMPSCDACKITKNSGMIDIYLHTCEYAEKHKRIEALQDNK